MAKERIELIDALRGLGVLGILTVNASFMASTFSQTVDPLSWPFPNTGASLGIWAFVHVFCDSKFITLFSLLFGVSTYLVGGEPGDARRNANLLRRFGWLVVFGVIHGALIWYGDILLDYALCGFAVMACRGWPARRLIAVGCIAFAAGVSAMVALSLAGDANPAIYAALLPGHAGKAAAFAGSFAQSLSANAATWMHTRLLLACFTIPYAAPLMLIGLGLFKSGFLTGDGARSRYVAAIVAGLLALLGFGAFTFAFIRSGFSDDYGALWDSVAINLTSPFISLGYASALILAARSAPLGWIARLLAPLGRMAFTNYIGQSVLMTMIFYGGRGLGLFDRVDRPGIALAVVAVWSIELAWSHWWLRRFDAGPLEWIWRCLTYNRLGPIRRPRTLS